MDDHGLSLFLLPALYTHTTYYARTPGIFLPARTHAHTTTATAARCIQHAARPTTHAYALLPPRHTLPTLRALYAAAPHGKTTPGAPGPGVPLVYWQYLYFCIQVSFIPYCVMDAVYPPPQTSCCWFISWFSPEHSWLRVVKRYAVAISILRWQTVALPSCRFNARMQRLPCPGSYTYVYHFLWVRRRRCVSPGAWHRLTRTAEERRGRRHWRSSVY